MSMAGKGREERENSFPLLFLLSICSGRLKFMINSISASTYRRLECRERVRCATTNKAQKEKEKEKIDRLLECSRRQGCQYSTVLA